MELGVMAEAGMVEAAGVEAARGEVAQAMEVLEEEAGEAAPRAAGAVAAVACAGPRQALQEAWPAVGMVVVERAVTVEAGRVVVAAEVVVQVVAEAAVAGMAVCVEGVAA